ncbi:multiheme c-type cytochrome [Maribacter chungangensis]|uniref:Multiheme c-type cytochrome n=1 Tax=Maribacter chungangensis TaxID=1069117 RepID=A0ABW3B6B6_9FLAO
MLKKLLFGIFFLAVILLGYFIYDNYKDISFSEYQEIKAELPVHLSGKKFAGSESCIPCHPSIYETHVSTAHYKTSAIADSENILGSFNEKDAKINLAGSQVIMTQDEENSYQISQTYHGKVLKKSKINITIGSGVKGQSYLTFEEDSLYQLQASYFTLTDNWINSPGYPNYDFKRPVMDNCIKCHVTFAKNKVITGNSNVYDKSSFIYGVDCERCHGPSQDHVDYRVNNIKNMDFDPIVRAETLNRKQQMDACAQCHAGLRTVQIAENPFSFIIGDNLEEHSRNYNSGKPSTNLDVHGNQYGLLVSSPCFKESTDMSCITCHDPHKNQRSNTKHFNSKCLSCHTKPENLHEKTDTSNKTDYSNCIKCHMPESPSSIMRVKSSNEDKEESVNVRSHLIGIYVDSILQN